MRWLGIGILITLLTVNCSNNKSTGAKDPPEAPTGLIGRAMSSSVIALSWLHNSSGQSGFIIFRRQQSAFNAIDTLAGGEISYYDVGLEDSTSYSYYVVAYSNNGESPGSNIVNVTTLHSTSAPYAPTNPNPADGAAVSGNFVTLSWLCSDPNSDVLIYDLRFGANSSPPLTDSNLTQNSCPKFGLSGNTTYRWRIIAKDTQGNQTMGPIWRFTTIASGNQPPNPPSSPQPPDGSFGIDIGIHLTWECTDPDNDQLTFDIYFGLGDPPPFIRTQTGTTYDPMGPLHQNEIYYWKVVASDGELVTTGPRWKFLTYPGLAGHDNDVNQDSVSSAADPWIGGPG